MVPFTTLISLSSYIFSHPWVALSVHKFYLWPLCSPVLSDNIHKVGIALLSEVLGTQLNQGRMIHSLTRCSRATSHAKTSSSPCASASFLLFLLEDITQGALTGPHWVIQWGTQETIGRPGALTRDELDEEREKEMKKGSQNIGKKYKSKENRHSAWLLSSLSDKRLKGCLTSAHAHCMCVVPWHCWSCALPGSHSAQPHHHPVLLLKTSPHCETHTEASKRKGEQEEMNGK